MTVPPIEDGWSDVELRNERLTGEDLDKLHVTGSRLVGCELSAASLADADLWRVELVDCRMSGVVLDRARLRDVTFTSCKLDTASLRRVTGERVTFTDCVLRETDLTESRWKDSRFFDCDLDTTVVTDGRFAGCRFHGSTIERVIGAGSLRGIVLGPEQSLSFGLRVLDALGVTADDDRSGDARSAETRR